MAKRKREGEEGAVKRARTKTGKKSYKSKAKEGLMVKKKELKLHYKKVQKDLKQVDKDLKSLGYKIRAK